MDTKQTKKKRAPIEQLRAAGEEARKKLIARGIVTEENTIEKLMKEKPDLILPGIPSYIPHLWTIKASQRMMYDLLRIWQAEGSKEKENNLTCFIEFTITEMNRMENVAKKKMDLMGKSIKEMNDIPVLGKVFEPVNQYETIKGMKKFFVDTFAVCVVVRNKTAKTSDFVNWFLDWTENLCEIWKKNEEKGKTKKANNG